MGILASPTLRTLGKQIRRYREAAGMTQAQLVERLDYSEGWLSNVETAQLRPRREAVQALEEVLGVPPGILTDVWDQLDAESLPAWARDWFDEESKADVIRSFETAIIPGLLQTEEYARALLKGDETAVAARMERQGILSREAPPMLRCVIDERALRDQIGDRGTMYDQLQHLAESVSPRITVQVVPASSNPHHMGAFTIATVEGSEVAYVETAVRGIVTSARGDLTRLAELWESIRTFALSQSGSIDLIKKVAEEQWTEQK
jgi:transcriptional regulator with XRE-family HTH domain